MAISTAYVVVTSRTPYTVRQNQPMFRIETDSLQRTIAHTAPIQLGLEVDWGLLPDLHSKRQCSTQSSWAPEISHGMKSRHRHVLQYGCVVLLSLTG